MEKERFHQLITNFTALSQEEAQVILGLQRDFPYSQVLHGLAARASQDNNLNDKEHHLHLCAIYSTDRAVLKSVMTALQQPRVVVETPIHKIEQPVIEEQSVMVAEEMSDTYVQTEVEIIHTPTNLSGDDLYNEVMHDIEILRERKAQFEQLVSNLENGLPVSSDSKSKKAKATDPDEGLLKEIKLQKKRLNPKAKSKKNRLILLISSSRSSPLCLR